jgi:2-polyprenyl-6-methoxyphenol hydroxylase-like FAD-dependent oxidoreductase
VSGALRRDDVCDCDVLVVGGGLVGLAASMFLAQQGLRVWVVERHASTSSHPKLRGVSARTMELYRSAGIEEAVRAAGENHFGVAIGDSLAGQYERVLQPRAVTRRNRLSPTTHYACDQDRMEPILLQRSAELGAQLFYGCTVVNIEQHESAVTADVVWSSSTVGRRTPAAPPSRITARYLLAADGASGTIRAGLGIGRHGEPVAGKGLSVLFDADLEPAMRGRRISALIDPAQGALLFARSDARDHNWFALTPRDGFDSIDQDSVATEAIPLIRSLVGLADLDINIRSATTWSTGAFIADRYREGRIFLVGDAAHLMPPYGGFGGNTGIADAHNLAWKLAAVCSGEAGDTLLDTYESERQPITEFTLKHIMLRAGSGIGQFFRQFDQFDPDPITLGFRYPMSTAAGFDPELPIEDPAQPSGQPGTRAPHIALKGAISSTLDLLDPGVFTFLAPDASSYASALRTRPVSGVRLREIRRQEIADRHTWDRIFPAPAAAGLLIRPDGVICWRAPSAHPDPALVVRTARVRALHSKT